MELVRDAEHDLDLLDRAPVAGQDVVDPRADEAAPSWASAQRRSAPSPMCASRCWNTTWSGPSSWRLAIASRAFAPRRISVVARQQAGRAGDDLVGLDELLDHRRLGALVEDDERAPDERPRGPDGPAEHDRPLHADAGRDVDDDALRPGGARQLGELLVGGQDRAAVEQRAGERLVRAHQLGERQHPDAGGPDVLVERDGRDALLAELEQGGDVGRQRRRSPGRSRRPRCTARRPRSGRPGGPGTACTGGCSRPAAPRTARAPRAGRRAASAGSSRSATSASTNARSRKATGRSVGERRGARAGRGRDDGSATSVIRATPPSRASRAG